MENLKKPAVAEFKPNTTTVLDSAEPIPAIIATTTNQQEEDFENTLMAASLKLNETLVQQKQPIADISEKASNEETY